MPTRDRDEFVHSADWTFSKRERRLAEIEGDALRLVQSVEKLAKQSRLESGVNFTRRYLDDAKNDALSLLLLVRHDAYRYSNPEGSLDEQSIDKLRQIIRLLLEAEKTEEERVKVDQMVVSLAWSLLGIVQAEIDTLPLRKETYHIEQAEYFDRYMEDYEEDED